MGLSVHHHVRGTRTISGGVLHGDLFVKSNGDPSINTRMLGAGVFDEWAHALRGTGIESINGRMIGDDQAFDDDGIGAGWAWDYLDEDYAAPVGALQYNEDVAALTIAPALRSGCRPIVQLQTGSGLELVNHGTTGPAGSPDTIAFRRHLDRPVLEVIGSIPLGSTSDVTSVAVVNPTLFYAHALKTELSARGITISGPAVDFDDVAAELLSTTTGIDHQDAQRSVMPIARSESPPLRDIATVLMKVSQNLYAETLLKAIGAQHGLGTAEGGRVTVRQTLTDWGVKPDSYVIYDGSGLSRYNYVTATTIADVLQHMYKDPRHHDAFLATLPIAGKDGTMATRLRGTRAERNVLAKTGSIANARSVSGFVKTRDGETLVFSILSNNFIIPSARITAMADLAIETLANFTRH